MRRLHTTAALLALVAYAAGFLAPVWHGPAGACTAACGQAAAAPGAGHVHEHGPTHEGHVHHECCEHSHAPPAERSPVAPGDSDCSVCKFLAQAADHSVAASALTGGATVGKQSQLPPPRPLLAIVRGDRARAPPQAI